MSAICDTHKKKVGVELLYNSVHRKFNQLEIRKPAPREAGPPGPRLSSPGKRERNAVVAIGVGVNMLQFCSVSNSLSHTTLSIKWEVYFSKELCCSSLLCRDYDSACICVYIVVHGYTTRTNACNHIWNTLVMTVSCFVFYNANRLIRKLDFQGSKIKG